MSRPPRRRPAQPQPTERLQKVLAQSGAGSRRDMEALIAAGRVTVNGKPAALGSKVGSGDRVRVDGHPVRLRFATRLPRVLLYHKPEGEVVSRDDPQQRASVFDRLPPMRSGRWVSVGRLDFNTCGLLIFTTSGTLANRLSHPRFEAEREYAVRVLGQLAPEEMRRLSHGIDLEDGFARFESLVDGGGEGSNHWYRVVVKEGRNRLVRRMFEAIGLTVSRLMRVRFGPVQLPPRLRKGMWQELDEDDIRALLAWAGLAETGVEAPARGRAAPTRQSVAPGAGGGARAGEAAVGPGGRAAGRARVRPASSAEESPRGRQRSARDQAPAAPRSTRAGSARGKGAGRGGASREAPGRGSRSKPPRGR